jgi:hypothetical protein
MNMIAPLHIRMAGPAAVDSTAILLKDADKALQRGLADDR